VQRGHATRRLWATSAAVRLVDPNLRITRAPHAPQTWPQECPSALTCSRGQLAQIAMAKLLCRAREMATRIGLLLKRPRHMPLKSMNVLERPLAHGTDNMPVCLN
jgi:hypothetical protein